ncbi:unnamed protein product [Sphagnum jensenii]|uniref:Uncharacterized protein n=1 Tax=Sphagnum jensenii TaxID=128206 RepID=A0ABP1BTZ1_9BRYO
MRAERTPNDTVTFMLQQPHPTDTPSIPMLRQIVQINNDDSDRGTTERLGSSNHKEVGARWSEICRRIKVDRNLDEGRQQQIWEVLERYQDVFTWNKEANRRLGGTGQDEAQQFRICLSGDLAREKGWKQAILW